MENNLSDSKKHKALLICGVLLLATINSSWTLTKKTLGNHECFVSITAREMLQSGDWVWPTCNGQPRLNKTPLSYWLVAGLAKITGEVDEFTTRLPSVVFAVLSVAAIVYFVSRWLSLRVAVISAAVWATTLSYIRYGHNARPEMALTFFILLCFLSFYSAITAESRKRQVVYMLIFWTSFGLGNLAKGPIPLPLILIPLFFYIAVFRQWKLIPKLLPVVGVLIFLAIVLPWPLAIANRVNWDLSVWKREFIDRFFGDYASGNKPIYYYLRIMFQFIIPWVGFLPLALAAPFYKVWNKSRPVIWFLWICFVAGLVFLTINGGKRQHYILPIMPAMAILIGIIIEDMAFARKAYTQKQARGTLRNHIIVVIAAAFIAPIVLLLIADRRQIHPAVTNSQFLTAIIILCAVTLIVAITVAITFSRGKTAWAMVSVFGGICALVMLGYVSLFNPLDYNQYSRLFSTKVSQIVLLGSPAVRHPLRDHGPKSDKLIAYEYVSNRSVHYFGKIIPEIKGISEVYERYEQGQWVMATAGRLEKLAADGRFRKVYFRQKAERRLGGNAPGALFHKSAVINQEDAIKAQ